VIYRIIQNYEAFGNLSRLQVGQMYKIINKKKHLLPESGPLDGYLENDDVVEFELSSLDIWLEVINTSNYENSAKFEIKVDSELSICELKSYLQK